MAGLAAIVTGTCTGHGVAIPAHIHNPGQGKPCGPTPVACPPYWTEPLPITTKNATCLWPPEKLELLTPIPRNVLINGQVPLLDGDVLIYHRSPTTNIVEQKTVSGDSCNAPIATAVCNCSNLTSEDQMGRGHDRIVKATTATVFINGRRLAAVGDPLGPPCLSTIGTGSANVLVGK